MPQVKEEVCIEAITASDRLHHKGRNVLIDIADVQQATYTTPDKLEGFRFLSPFEMREVNDVYARIHSAVHTRMARARREKTLAQKELERINAQAVGIQEETLVTRARHIYIEAAIQASTREELPAIAHRRGFYSLWMGNAPVCRLIDEKTAQMMRTEYKTRPFTLVQTKLRYLPFARELIGLARGDYCDENSARLYGSALEFAKMLFEKVERGVEIFPAENRQGFHIPRKEETERTDPLRRHWGQVFLSSLHPEEIREGELLGSGVSYRAYFFKHDKVIVECDESARATYLLDAHHFEQLRHWARLRLLSQQPEGFEGRIIHSGESDRERMLWQQRVLSHLNKK